MIEDTGIYWYCGYTGVSKTRSAVFDAWSARDRRECPIVVIDGGRVWNFEDYEHAPDVRTLTHRVWTDRAKAVAISPEDEIEVDQIFGLARRLKNVVLLCDEAADWIDENQVPKRIRKAMRQWRHGGLLMIFTTQRIQDINPKAMAVHKEIRIFRIVESAGHDRLWERWKIKAEEVLGLPDEHFITIREGVLCRNPDGSPKVSSSLDS